jgi:hypothetical protein
MAKTVTITIAAAGTDTGPFNLFSNADTYANAFATGVLKADLLSGYTSSAVPDLATIIRVKSNNANCTNYVDMTITNPTPAPSITFTVNNPSQFNYPISAGNGSASGTITNNSGSTIYVYTYFNSGGQSSGTIQGDSGTVNGGLALDIPGGPITSSGQAFYSTNYETLLSNNVTVNWNINKQDGFSSGATLSLAYSTTVGGSKMQLLP